MIFQVETTVLPGQRIEIQTPQLPEGCAATVTVQVPDAPKRQLSEVLASYPGHQLFRTAAEVEEYLQRERDSWDR